MDFELDKDQRAWRDEVRAFLRENATEELHRERRERGPPFAVRRQPRRHASGPSSPGRPSDVLGDRASAVRIHAAVRGADAPRESHVLIDEHVEVARFGRIEDPQRARAASDR